MSGLEGRDWSLLEATQDSLREHMALAKKLKQELDELRGAAVSISDELAPGWYWAKPSSEYIDFQPVYVLGDGKYQCNGQTQNMSVLTNVELFKVALPHDA